MRKLSPIVCVLASIVNRVWNKLSMRDPIAT